MDLIEQIVVAWQTSTEADPETRVRRACASVLKVKGRPTAEERTALEAIWQTWLRCMGYATMQGRPMGLSREKYALARLREGRTVEEFQQILEWVSTDPFLRGKNQQGRAYDDYDTLFGSSAKFEKYLKLAVTPKRAAVIQDSLAYNPAKSTSYL
jgi:hypothetical protein